MHASLVTHLAQLYETQVGCHTAIV